MVVGLADLIMSCDLVTRKWQIVMARRFPYTLQVIMAATQDVEHREIPSNLCVRSSTCGFFRTDQPQHRSFPRSGSIAEPRNIVCLSFWLYDARLRIALDQHPNHPIAGKLI